MNENQDLLDLCRLNAMEPNVEASPDIERDLALKGIDWKRRQLATKIINNRPTPSPEEMQRHLDEQVKI